MKHKTEMEEIGLRWNAVTTAVFGQCFALLLEKSGLKRYMTIVRTRRQLKESDLFCLERAVWPLRNSSLETYHDGHYRISKV